MTDIKILYVTPDYSVEVRTLDPADLAAFQELVGGYIEAIYSDSFTAFINEEGRLYNLPPNGLASVLAFRFGWQRAAADPLLGPVVFVGAGATAQGDVLPVSDELISEAQVVAERMRP